MKLKIIPGENRRSTMGTKVFLDDMPIKCRAITLHAEADDVWRCQIDLVPSNIEIDGEIFLDVTSLEDLTKKFQSRGK